MEKEHAHDISIGKDQWIIFEDLQNNHQNAFKIDPFMEELIPMWKALETQCVSECCGIDAYELWADDVLMNTSEFNHQELKYKLIQLQKEIEAIQQTVVVSTTLNNYFTKTTFLQIIEHLIHVYRNA